MVEVLDDLLREVNSLENQIKEVESDLLYTGTDLLGIEQISTAEVEVSPSVESMKTASPVPVVKPIVQGPESAIETSAIAKVTKPVATIAQPKSVGPNSEFKSKPGGIGSVAGTNPSQQNVSSGSPKEQQNVIQVPSVQYTSADIPSLAFLIKRLSELIDLNSRISEELQEVIAISYKVDVSKRLSSLINKLAYASIYG